jgi:hypothetical protein
MDQAEAGSMPQHVAGEQSANSTLLVGDCPPDGQDGADSGAHDSNDTDGKAKNASKTSSEDPSILYEEEQYAIFYTLLNIF